MKLTITHNKDANQFVTIVDGKISRLDYSVSSDGKTLNFYSTFVPPELRGRNLGQEIVKFALDFAKENDCKIIPSCPFVKRFIDNHPEYENIVTK